MSASLLKQDPRSRLPTEAPSCVTTHTVSCWSSLSSCDLQSSHCSWQNISVQIRYYLWKWSAHEISNHVFHKFRAIEKNWTETLEIHYHFRTFCSVSLLPYTEKRFGLPWWKVKFESVVTFEKSKSWLWPVCMLHRWILGCEKTLPDWTNVADLENLGLLIRHWK